MTDPKEKSQRLEVATREPRKKKPDIFANLRTPQPHPVEEIMGLTEASAPPISSTTTPLPTTPHHSPPVTTTPQQERPDTAAPARDFNRRANSIERDAMPGGLFPGSSKKIYDALYLRSRGAHPPRETVRASRRDFLDWTDIRNLKTVDGHLRYLMSVGLIVRNWQLGSTEGSEYRVRLPEELPPLPTTPHHSPAVTTSQLSGSGDSRFSGSGGEGQVVEGAGAYGDGKTFKTNTERSDDDEAFGRLRRAIKEETGKDVSAAELRELDEVLALEFKIAASRTTVSSGPAFIAEHVRRRLFKKDKRELAEEAARAPVRDLPASVDVKACPDCHGSNYFYPEGYERGVRRCTHEQLRKASEINNPS